MNIGVIKNKNDDDDNDVQALTASEQEQEEEEESKRETKVRELADILEKKYYFAAMEDTEELLYHSRRKGYFEPAAALVKARLEKLQPGILIDTVTNVIQKVARRHLVKRDTFDADKNILNMKNGLYDIAAGKLRRHTHSYLSRNQIPVTYDPRARCNGLKWQSDDSWHARASQLYTKFMLLHRPKKL